MSQPTLALAIYETDRRQDIVRKIDMAFGGWPARCHKLIYTKLDYYPVIAKFVEYLNLREIASDGSSLDTKTHITVMTAEDYYRIKLSQIEARKPKHYRQSS